MLGESHWSRASGEFYLSLVRAPEFSDRVNTVVLECGSSQYQPVLDRYMNGEDVPFEQLSQVWRNTSKTISWDSPIYANLITALRDVNRGLPPTRRLRVLAAAPPIDWNRIHTRAEWLEASGEDKWFAELIQREVLDKKRNALVIMGANHVTHGGNWRNTDDTTSLLEKHNPHSVYVAMLWGIPGGSDPAITRNPVPSLTALGDTRLGRADYYGRHAEDVADAFLYLGRSEEIAFPDWAALQADKKYWAELQRRHQIQFGCPIDINRWNRQDRPCQ